MPAAEGGPPCRRRDSAGSDAARGDAPARGADVRGGGSGRRIHALVRAPPLKQIEADEPPLLPTCHRPLEGTRRGPTRLPGNKKRLQIHDSQLEAVPRSRFMGSSLDRVFQTASRGPLIQRTIARIRRYGQALHVQNVPAPIHSRFLKPSRQPGRSALSKRHPPAALDALETLLGRGRSP